MAFLGKCLCSDKKIAIHVLTVGGDLFLKHIWIKKDIGLLYEILWIFNVGEMFCMLDGKGLDRWIVTSVGSQNVFSIFFVISLYDIDTAVCLTDTIDDIYVCIFSYPAGIQIFTAAIVGVGVFIIEIHKIWIQTKWVEK